MSDNPLTYSWTFIVSTIAPPHCLAHAYQLCPATCGKPRASRYLDQICYWPREREKRPKWEGGMARVRSCKRKGAIIVSLLRLRTSAIFFVASCFFAFGTSPERRKCEDICEWPQRNTIAIRSIFQKCITIKTSSARFWKVPAKTQKEVEFKHVLTMFRRSYAT